MSTANANGAITGRDLKLRTAAADTGAMRRRPVVSVVVSVSLGTLLAGAGAIVSPARAEAAPPAWAAKAEAICAKAQIDIVTGLRTKRIDLKTPAGADQAFLIAEAAYRKQIEQLRKLPTDSGERKKLEKMITSLEKALEERKSNLAERKTEKKNPFDKPTKQAAELGLSCRF